MDFIFNQVMQLHHEHDPDGDWLIIGDARFPIEEHLFASPYILEAVVFGRKKQNKQGEDVLAVIVPDLDQISIDFDISPDSPDMAELKKVMDKIVSEINSSMSAYKRINSFEIQLEELEKTSTKKVKRFVYG